GVAVPLLVCGPQVGSVAAHAQRVASADVDAVVGAGVDVDEVLDLGAQSLALPLAAVEPREPLDAVLLAGGDLVEVGLHRGGEVVVDEPRQVLLEQPDDGERQPGGYEGLATALDVAAVGDDGDRCRVG